jgi:GTP-binding protein
LFVAVPLPTAGITLQVRLTVSANKYVVSGRGELHLTVLTETIYHMGFKIKFGPPVVTNKTDSEMGKKDETFEMVEVRVSEENSGIVSGLFNNQKGKLQDMGLAKNGDSMRVIK